MRLQSILLINRAPYEKLELQFDKENISLLSGVNGAGKTTILSYIVDAFHELAKKGYGNEYRGKSEDYYRVSSGLFSLNNNKPSIVYLRFVNHNSNIDYIDIRGKCDQTEYDEIIPYTDKIAYAAFQMHLNNQNHVKYWSMQSEKDIVSIFSSNILTYFPAYRYELPAYLNNAYDFSLNYHKTMNYTGYLTNPIEVISDLPAIANWIMDVVLDWQIYKDNGTAHFVFDQLNSILTNILIPKVKHRVRLGIGKRNAGANRISIMNMDKEEETYPSIFAMSSGELALLCLFGEIIRQADRINNISYNATGIVLIDEIDKHLHIKLQKEILPSLLQMYPKLQFIVTSHSPFIGLGLAETKDLSFSIYDLDNRGIISPVHENDLVKEVYNMMLTQNDQYYQLYQDLQQTIQQAHKPLIITEGKTDWKHLYAAMNALSITDIDIELYKNTEAFGDKNLITLLNNLARFPNSRQIIGIFDRDKLNENGYEILKNNKFVSLNNNVYAFAIPLVNEEEYGDKISIEHYYHKAELTKTDEDGRRIFLGTEFYPGGISCDSKYYTRFSGINEKAQTSSIIDSKVYRIQDPEGKKSVAMSKNDFAEHVLKKDAFSSGFDFSSFNHIFNVIKEIYNNNNV